MKYKISSGVDSSKGIKTVIYGVEGIGKTTLASRFPDPLFIDTEGSTSHFDSVKRMPKPEDWPDLFDQVKWIGSEKPCKTLVIDTFDWAEQAEVADLIATNEGWTSIESAGYGKGYVLSAERILSFLKLLDTELIDRGINVILTCHAQIKKFELPDERGSFDKYELKLGAKTGSRTSPLVKEWADMVLFCNFKTYTEVTNDGFGNTKAKATGGTERVMYTTHSAVWDAKNRFGLADELPMSFKPLAKIFKKSEPEEKPEPKEEPKPAKTEEPKTEEQPKEAPKPKKKRAKKAGESESDKAKREAEAAEAFLMPGFPDGVPDSVIDFCGDKGILPEDIQKLIYIDGLVPKLDYNLAKVPAKFWKSLTSEYESRWADKIKKIQDDGLPF